MERLAKQTKRKDISFVEPVNQKVIEGQDAAVLEIPALKQVTATFIFKTTKEADEFFNRFQAKV